MSQWVDGRMREERGERHGRGSRGGVPGGEVGWELYCVWFGRGRRVRV